MVVRISDKTQNYSKITKLLVKPKEIRICEDIEKRVPDIEEKLKMINALETQRMQTQKEYERSLNL